MPGLNPAAEVRLCAPAQAARLEADIAVVVDVLGATMVAYAAPYVPVIDVRPSHNSSTLV